VKRQVNTKSEHFDRPGSESYMKSGLVAQSNVRGLIIWTLLHGNSYSYSNIII
jgi:hypothetical protein